MNVLEVREARAGYGPTRVLKGVSLEVRPGEIVALLGANGAGKSTTLLTIAGVVPMESGAVFWNGEPLPHNCPEDIVRRGVLLCPEGRRIFPRLTVEENLRLGAYLRPSAEVAPGMGRVYGLFPVLAERRRQMGGTLSGGEQQMLAIGRSLMGRPKLLMLDEPSLGLAPLFVEKIFSIIVDINREGTPILLVEQNARQALKIAHRGYVMVTGQIELSDTGANLLASDEVRQAYLGE